LMTA